MGLVQDFVGRVSDAYRGGAAPSSANAALHGSGFQSTKPAVAAWLDGHPEVSDALAKVSSTVAALEGAHEGSIIAFNKGREKLDATKADESRAHYDARELGKSVDPDLAKRHRRAVQAAASENEERADRATIASNAFANSREALNSAVKFVGTLAAERSNIVLVPEVDVSNEPATVLTVIIDQQRNLIADLDIERSEIEAAPLPLEDAIEMVRARIGGESPRILLGPQTADWEPPQTRLNVAAQLGDQPVDIVNTTALIEWLLGDTLADRLEELIRIKYAGVERTFTPIERRKALADVDARRLQAERVEVAAIFAAWAEGNYVPLRKDTSPLALLGIERVTEGDAKEPEGYIGSAYLGETAR